MLPAPDQLPSQDAHVPVADPDTARHPEEAQADMSGMHSAAASAVSGTQAQDSAPDLDRDGTAVDEEQRVWQRQPILLDVQKECFSRLLLLPEILTDHLPDTYLAAVQQL